MFTIENQEFGWDEIVSAAEVWGEWQPFAETVRQTLACLRCAAKTGQMPTAGETRDAANTFRYSRNLISAEDARSWLARYEMSAEDWLNYLSGKLLQERWARRLNEIVAKYPISNAEVEEAIKHHATCAGRLDDWGLKLAGRARV